MYTVRVYEKIGLILSNMQIGIYIYASLVIINLSIQKVLFTAIILKCVTKNDLIQSTDGHKAP